MTSSSVRDHEVSEPEEHDHERDAVDHDHTHGASHLELVAAFVALGIYLVARSLDWFSSIGTPVTVLYITAAVVTGVFVFMDALGSLQARRFDIDQLMLVAAVGAACIGHWSDSALLLVLFSVGHALEGYAMRRAGSAITALGKLAPAVARRRQAPDVEVPIGELEVGDVIIVRPNERIAADGVVVAGWTTIDESAVTGESMPVAKFAVENPAGQDLLERSGRVSGLDDINSEHRVFAGTLNGSGAVETLVLRRAEDSTLAKVVQLVAEAETQISPTQRFSQNVVRVLVPSVLILVVLLIAVPPLLGKPFVESFARAMAVLVAASPCALAIATPSAVLATVARAARNGILVKGGGPLEELAAARTIAFDKTGTLTAGRPTVTDIIPMGGVSELELLKVARAVEASSNHPIARALVAAANEREEPSAIRRATTAEVIATNVVAVAGMGVTGEIDGQQAMLGNAAMFDGVAMSPSVRTAQQDLETRGRTTVIVRVGESFLGVLGVMDAPRPEAIQALADIRSLGISDIVMLSGDSQAVASAVAVEIGITDARGALMPADKMEAVAELGQRGGVVMVGDGVNDAPALATANVGIAMGAAGSDVALETADIALMADRLDQLPFAIGLARRGSRTMRQNLLFSLAIIAVLIPLTLLGIGISATVIVHEGSTLVVVLNALRLLNYRPSTAAGAEQ